jgi:hypothetical protein
MKLKNRPLLCKNYLKIPKEKSEYLIVSDEAYFYLTNRIWDIERPTDGIEKPLHYEKLLVFCAISATKIYGAYYFSTSVNQHNYLEMLKVWFWPKHLRTSEYKNIIFSKMGPWRRIECTNQCRKPYTIWGALQMHLADCTCRYNLQFYFEKMVDYTS